MKAAKRKLLWDDVRRLDGCDMELARGASHIASMLYEHSMLLAVRETLLQFEACHRHHDVKAFAHALLGKLQQRGKPEAVKVLHDFIEHGRLPEPTSGAPHGPDSGRKRGAQSLRGIQPSMGKARATAKAA